MVQRLLGNLVYTGTWPYRRTKNIATDEGNRVFAQPADTWIAVPVPPLVDEETWEGAQAAKRARYNAARRNTKALYLLQHLLRCTECGRKFRALSRWRTHATRGGKRVAYDLKVPLRYYACTGSVLRLRCRDKPTIKAERLEQRVWEEVKGVLQEPSVIVAGIVALDEDGGSSLAEEQTKVERDLREVQLEEQRLVRLFVTDKITEEMLDLQRKFITERIEHLHAKAEEYRARAATAVTREQMAESVQAWAETVAQGLDTVSAEEQRGVLREVVDEITVDRDNNLVITIAIPMEQDEQQVASQESR